MALQTSVAAFELRTIRLFLIQRIEDDPLLGIVRGNFDNIAAADESYGHMVIEVQRARHARRNTRRLETRLREHKDLRLDRNVQGLQYRRQIPLCIIERELDLTARDLLLKSRDCIV